MSDVRLKSIEELSELGFIQEGHLKIQGFILDCVRDTYAEHKRILLMQDNTYKHGIPILLMVAPDCSRFTFSVLPDTPQKFRENEEKYTVSMRVDPENSPSNMFDLANSVINDFFGDEAMLHLLSQDDFVRVLEGV